MARIPDPQEDFDDERREWLDSFDFIYRQYGREGIREILSLLEQRALNLDIAIDDTVTGTPYLNTIPISREPSYPGDLAIEQRIENLVRWNATAMVIRAADSGSGVGGHLSTHASAATMMEVGQQHFFRCADSEYGGDLVMLQPAATPAIYARAWLEGRLTLVQLENYRRELQPGGGLPSYTHPRLLPNFWQIPSASMGLASPAAIYQARFAKYLENRGMKPANGGKVWCFIGDGEADEPEVLGTLNIAARERLNNLILVINCNLQSLDGPVRGNGKIIQELERNFRGAGWRVIKVIWGSEWDRLLAADRDGALKRRMEATPDGDYQRLSTSPGAEQRRFWSTGSPAIEAILAPLSDEAIEAMRRGGQDPLKIHAAFAQAAGETEAPTVILIKTVKGDGMGEACQGRNTTHVKKQLSIPERRNYARYLGIPLSREAVDRAEFYRPPDDSPEMRYLGEKRQRLGGFLPDRRVSCGALQVPELSRFQEFFQGTGEREVSTTMAMVRMLSLLLKDPQIGRFLVPIVPDEARTFGLDSLFASVGIYSPEGQNYTPVDNDSLLSYRQSSDGQLLQEGICEIGAISTFMAAGSAYATYGIPTIPFYFFYSMFGFQRVGDSIWACGDIMCRGFLLGGTAGRTTLNGEGLQHQDGHSQILSSTVPSLRSYDPAFAYELAVIVQDGLHRMYQLQEDRFYYITLYNENYAMPELPAGRDTVEGILRGIYCFRKGKPTENRFPQVHILASGPFVLQALEAQSLLHKRGVNADVWSVTSFTELYRDAVAAERWNRLHPAQPRQQSYLGRVMSCQTGIFIAVSDYMKSLPGSLAPWIPGPYQVLGTDGYGRSESRSDLRDYFEIDARHIVVAALHGLAREGAISVESVTAAIHDFDIDPDKPSPAEV